MKKLLFLMAIVFLMPLSSEAATFGYTSVGATSETTYFACRTTNDTSQTVGFYLRTSTLSNLVSITSLSGAFITSDADSETVDTFMAVYERGASSHPLLISDENTATAVTGTAGFSTFDVADTTANFISKTYIIALLCDGNDLVDGDILPVYDSTGTTDVYTDATTGVSSYTTRKSENPWAGASSVIGFTRQYSVYYTYTDLLVAPTVAAMDVSDIFQDSVTLNGAITATGSQAFDLGFRYGTVNLNTATVTVATASSSVGVFSTTLSSLTPATAYQYQAWASSTYSGTTYFTYGATRNFVTADYIGTAGSDIGFCYNSGTRGCFTGVAPLPNTNARMGYRFGANFGSITTGFRFPNIAVPAGSTVTAARFVYTPWDTDATSPPTVKIFAEDADNSVTFSSSSSTPEAPRTVDYGGSRATTTAYVSWTLPNQTALVATSSPDISTVIQEVIDRAGWASGNAISIFMGPEDFVDNFNASNATSTAGLIIDYTSPAGETGTAESIIWFD